MPQKKSLWNIVSEILLPLCVYYLVNTAISILGLTYLESRKGALSLLYMGKPVTTLLAGFIRMIVFLCSVVAVFGFYKKEKVFCTEPKKKMEIKEAVPVMLLGAVSALVLNIIWGRLPWFQNNSAYERVTQSQFEFPLWMGLILYGIVSPWAEEVMFRGILYSVVTRHIGHLWGLLCSSLLFGVFHGNVVQATYGMVMGGIMAYLYKRFGTLLAPFLFHSVANVVVYFVQQLK